MLADNTTDACLFADFRVSSSANILLKIGQRGGSLYVISLFGAGGGGGTGLGLLKADNTNGAFAVRLLTLHVQVQNVRYFVLTPVGKRRFQETYGGVNNRFVGVTPNSPRYVGVVRVQRAVSPRVRLVSRLSCDRVSSVLTEGVRRLVAFFSLLVPSVAGRRRRVLSRTLVDACTGFNVARSGSSLCRSQDYSPPGVGGVPVVNSLRGRLRRGPLAGHVTVVVDQFIANSTRDFGRRAGISLDGGCVILSLSRLGKGLLPIKVFVTLSCI